MKYIAHRGLVNGPDKILENKPSQIESTILLGFDCEIDLRVYVDIDTNSYKFWLGHDDVSYEIAYEFLLKWKNHLWIHAKNLTALQWLCEHHDEFNYFSHDQDDFVITSKGFIWTYPEKPLTKISVCLMPEWHRSVEDLKSFKPDCYGICSDYVSIINSKK